ncbi:hypothetical protein NX059_004203 [Plenodomus lindquistii]|nr:hypothetical protein NX059_004203 [Plenodomus lindquistii]
MVLRLLVVEGEGQHGLTTDEPSPAAAQPRLLQTPGQSVILALGLNALLAATVGTRPGLFLKSVAIINAVHLSVVAGDVYAAHEINRAIFKRDGIEAKPGKLWELSPRSDLSVEDFTVAGGLLGCVVAMNRRAFPGVQGWRRYFGAATVGLGVGYQAGSLRLLPRFPNARQDWHMRQATFRRQQYVTLQQDESAKASLSWIAKIVLASWTKSPIGRNANAEPSSKHTATEITGMKHYNHPDDPWLQSGTQNDSWSTAPIDPATGECVFDPAALVYDDFFTTQNPETLKIWLEKLHGARKRTDAELQYCMQCLAELRHEYAALTEHSRARDVLRRAVFLMGLMVRETVQNAANWNMHIADTEFRLQALSPLSASKQTSGISRTDSAYFSSIALTASPSSLADSQSHIDSTYAPNITARRLRGECNGFKYTLSLIDQVLELAEKLPGHDMNDSTVQKAKGHYEPLIRNIEAVDMLLHWFEAKVQEVEARS